MSERIRILTKEDVPAAMQLKSAANWNQTAEDWVRFVDLEPQGCTGIEVDGTLAATAGAIRYQTRLGWIGMVLTLPEFRGRGFAGRLMEACISFLDTNDVEWMKLDATAQGRPMYARLGFREECPIERWYRAPNRTAPVELESFQLDRELDLQAFGADRSTLLAELSRVGASSMSGQGYAMVRPGSEAFYFGPCVSRSPESARRLLEWGLGRAGDRPVYWDILPSNSEAVRLASGFGFERRRELIRMCRAGAAAKRPIESDNSLVYAIAGFEYG
jgi:GNAT superfamily N-acetyltransferase